MQRGAEKLPRHPLPFGRAAPNERVLHPKDRAEKRNVILLLSQPRLKCRGITGAPEAKQTGHTQLSLTLPELFALSLCHPFLPRKELQPVKERMTE